MHKNETLRKDRELEIIDNGSNWCDIHGDLGEST